ncbi:unnamed protein product [Cyclocybe aegerita]|uniref:Uncharacterized protein n=1 Tax=Cyclocybe aegerita TaxID=1973307 RepID=A0A8S0VTH9_CYCAE|nr:unnamed protein product [Cyclocybe aegerita]
MNKTSGCIGDALPHPTPFLCFTRSLEPPRTGFRFGLKISTLNVTTSKTYKNPPLSRSKCLSHDVLLRTHHHHRHQRCTHHHSHHARCVQHKHHDFFSQAATTILRACIYTSLPPYQGVLLYLPLPPQAALLPRGTHQTNHRDHRDHPHTTPQYPHIIISAAMSLNAVLRILGCPSEAHDSHHYTHPVLLDDVPTVG